MKKNGFTLIEILVVIGIFGILAVIGTSMFFSILKGSTKTRVLAEVKQNGNYAISVMGRMIRNAKSIESCPGSSITIENQDRDSTTFSCSGGRVASNSAYLTSDKVAVTNCTNVFTCNLGVSPNVVTIDFTLSQAMGTRAEETAQVDFKTTVSLRTY